MANEEQLQEESAKQPVRRFIVKVLVQLGQTQTVVEVFPVGVDQQDALQQVPELVQAFIKMQPLEMAEVTQ
jgi:hypothetical protein